MLPPGAITAIIVSLAFVGVAAAGPLHLDIDRLIAAGHPNYDKLAAPLADDAEFLRRITLDLNGTIPTAAEARTFFADKSPDKRAKLIDTLIARPAYARRMAQHFDVAFMERRSGNRVPQAAWEEYLRTSFGENKPYDQLAREILAADGADPKNRGPAKFYLDRNFEPNLVTRDVARVFLGRDLRCAQCHDHPNIDGYLQADYFGILAFLSRSYVFTAGKETVLAEKADGGLTFVSVFDKAKKTGTAAMHLPGGKPIEEPKVEKGKEYKVPPGGKDVRPVPTVSRRELLAKAVTAADNQVFARTAANRLWAMMLGRGVVNPVDLEHDANPPSHPELMNLLAKEFASHKFDVKWLIREIALSKTYQRSSAVPAGLKDVPDDRYLVGIIKALSPEQFGYAVLQATGLADSERQALGAKLTDAALDARLAGQVSPFRNAFAGSPGEVDESGGASLDQTLFLKHSGTVRNLTAMRAGNLTERMTKLKDSKAASEELFLSVMTRLPTPEEQADIAAILAEGERTTAIREAIWALIASAEFRFNH